MEEERLTRIPAHSNARRVNYWQAHLVATLVCDGARFTKPALPISTHIRYRFRPRAGSYTAGSLPAVPRFSPIVVPHLLAAPPHERQHPFSHESLEHRSHTHERTSSLPQALHSTVHSSS